MGVGGIMRIVKKDIMPDGTKIQLEDWSEDYSCFAPIDCISAYPVSKMSIKKARGYYYPVVNEKFRCSFHFGIDRSAELAFVDLAMGNISLLDIAEFLWYPWQKQCL